MSGTSLNNSQFVTHDDRSSETSAFEKRGRGIFEPEHSCGSMPMFLKDVPEMFASVFLSKTGYEHYAFVFTRRCGALAKNIKLFGY